MNKKQLLGQLEPGQEAHHNGVSSLSSDFPGSILCQAEVLIVSGIGCVLMILCLNLALLSLKYNPEALCVEWNLRQWASQGSGFREVGRWSRSFMCYSQLP